MKIYTKTGDKGETGLMGGKRVAKDSQRVEAYGSVDETNASIGFVRAANKDKELEELLARIQNELFVLGADLATPDERSVPRITAANVEYFEKTIDKFEAELEPLKKFILPTGSETAARLHLARGVCRRAERTMWALSRKEKVSEQALIYMNRLSDLLFVLSRVANKRAGLSETKWQV